MIEHTAIEQQENSAATIRNGQRFTSRHTGGRAREDFSILIVDDNRDFCYSLFDFFDALGFEVSGTHEPKTALHLLKNNGGFDAVIVDLDMPELTGLELLEEARTVHRDLTAILVTGREIDSRLVTRARAAGCVKIHSKPVDFHVLHHSIEHLRTPSQRAPHRNQRTVVNAE